MTSLLNSSITSPIFSAFLVISLILSIVVMPNLPGIHGLMQVAGDVIIPIKPGETKSFSWGLLSENQNETRTVKLSADGNGSEFLTFPSTYQLSPGTITEIKGNVTIPADQPTGIQLNPTIRAVELKDPTQNVTNQGGMVINIEMAKILSISVGENSTETVNQSIQNDLIG